MDMNDPPPAPSAPTALTPAAGDVPKPTRQAGSLSPLRRRNFSLLFSGQLISVIGDQVYGLALPWTVLAITRDPRQVAFVLTAATVPRVLLLLVGGALSDRITPRVVMLGADAGRALVVGVLGVTLFWGLPPLWALLLLAGLEGAGSGLFGPGVQALLPRIVPEEELPAGNGLMMVVQYSTLAIGPLLGGVATAAQATYAFLADAASFVVSAVSLFGIRLPARAPAAPPARADAAAEATNGTTGEATPPRGGLLREIGAGLAYTFRQPLVRSTMLVTIFGNFGFAGALNVALIVLSRNLSPSPVTLGVLLAAAGVGGVVGGLSAALLARVPRRGLVALVLYGLSAVFLGLVPLAAGSAGHLPFALNLGLGTTTRIGVVAALMALIGLIIGLGDTMVLTIMQQRIAPEYMARVFSAQFLAGGVTQPLSLVVAGYLSATYGPGIAFVGGAVVLLIGIVLGLSSRELREI
jgi:MFS family permease